MKRVTLAASWLIFVAAVAAPSVALADERPPCSGEADAVKNMKTRDPSLAYPTNPSAKEHLEAGKRAFGVQQYDKAIEEYTAAGLADDAPLILYDLGQTYRSAKDYAKAIRQYELFLERGKPGTEVRALVTCHIATMKSELDHAASTAPPTGPVSEPSTAQSNAPATRAVEQEHGATHVVVADKPEAKSTSRWTGKRKLALGLALGGAAVLGAGTVFAIQNGNYKDDADRLCPSSPCAKADEANALSERASTRATLANVSFGIGAGLVAGAVVLWLVGAPSPSHGDTDETAIIPHLTPTFSGVAFSGRF